MEKMLRQIVERFFSYKGVFILLILIAITVVFGFLSEWKFTTWTNLSMLFRIAPEMGIVALGMALLLISGEFDLSVGSMFAFCSMVAAWPFVHWGWHPVISLSLALATGALLGFVNGMIVTKTRISSLIATLGMMWVYRGLLLIITAGYAVYYYPEHESPLFSEIFTGSVGPIPVQIIWMIGVAILIYILLEHTKFGNRILATGSRKESARMMGINTDKVKIICFMVLGVLVALAAVMQSCRIHGAYGVQGQTLNLESIGAAVVGGTSIYGGVGTISGAFCGALIVRFLDTGLLIIGLSMFHFYVVLGLLLVVVVSINIWLRKRGR